jgi:serine/threonine protein phosphatase 1
MRGLVYAIGDIHGRLDLFDQLIDRIRADASRFSEAKPTIVLLGDLIDRGPASAGCMQRALNLFGEDWCEVELLLGNHEESMLGFLQDASTGEPWLRHGGDATIASYGVDPRQASRAGWNGLRDALAAAVPRSHVEMLAAAKLWLGIGDYIFVHAGVRPGAPMEQQTAQDLLWIRQEFLHAEGAPCPGKIVVHGHTPTPEPRITRWTIGVDTGAYASGILTAVRLRGYERTVLQTL